jgi:hypothetical protein
MRVEFSDFTQLLFGSEFGHRLLMESSHSPGYFYFMPVFFCADRRAKDAEPASALGEMNDYLRPRGFALVPLLN